jgi:peptidoglycan-associated lipoprotein
MLPEGAEEGVMNKALFLLICIVLTSSGCNKNRKVVASSDDASGDVQNGDKPVATAPKVEKRVTASGDIKTLLLALKRVHFAYDSNTLTTTARQALSEAAERLESLPEVALYVDGHTDERGTTEYNMSLGEHRAQAVVQFLRRAGVDSERLSIVSFGEESPLVRGSGMVPYAQNRRVEFRLMRGNVQFVLEDSDLVDDKGNAIQNANAEDLSKEMSESNYDG